MYYSLITLFVE